MACQARKAAKARARDAERKAKEGDTPKEKEQARAHLPNMARAELTYRIWLAPSRPPRADSTGRTGNSMCHVPCAMSMSMSMSMSMPMSMSMSHAHVGASPARRPMT